MSCVHPCSSAWADTDANCRQISDGLSVFKLVNELFTLASSPSRPSPTSPPTFARLDAHLSGELQQPPWSVPDETTSNWQLTLAEEAVLAHLPLASEEHYPVLPLLPPRSATPPVQPTENPSRIASPVPPQHSPPSIPHLRWLWAITRTILLQRQSHFPRTLYIPRLPHPLPPPQARNRWPRWRLEREPSSRVIRFCKTHSVSPSALHYQTLCAKLTGLRRHAPLLPHFPLARQRPEVGSSRRALSPYRPRLSLLRTTIPATATSGLASTTLQRPIFRPRDSHHLRLNSPSQSSSRPEQAPTSGGDTSGGAARRETGEGAVRHAACAQSDESYGLSCGHVWAHSRSTTVSRALVMLRKPAS